VNGPPSHRGHPETGGPIRFLKLASPTEFFAIIHLRSSIFVELEHVAFNIANVLRNTATSM
jgi:hypothetical protein